MLKRYGTPETKWDAGLVEIDNGPYVLYSDVEPLLKRLAELEAKEQKREQFEQECG